MTVGKQEMKALALACDPAKCADEAEEGRRLAEFYSELTPEVVMALLAEIERIGADRKACWEEFKVQGRQLDQLKGENKALQAGKRTVECRFEVSEDTLSTIRGCLRAAESDIDQLKAENEALRKDAERWRFVRNAVPNRSPFAVWLEGSLPFLGSKADEAVDAAMAKESSQ